MARHYMVGQLEVLTVDDGTLTTSLDLVSGIPREAAQALTGADAHGGLVISVNNFVFQRDGATVLIDAGAADTMQPTLGKLPANLVAAGIAPDAISHVILTHLHPDHANGLVGPDGAAVFPNAALLIAAQEYDFWMGPEGANDSDVVKQMRARNQVNVAPYRDRTRRMAEDESALGCTVLLAPGHTPGHTCWLIETGGQALLAWGDTVHLAGVQIKHPEAALEYDMDKELAKRTRARILEMAAAEGLMVAGAHLDAPGLGRIVRVGAGFAFEPA